MACTACGSERGHFYDCPEGGLAMPAAAPVVPRLEDDGSEALERALLIAAPLVLAGFWLLNLTELGNALTRIVFAMWLHETGHALTAWLCGAFAVPLPWVTMGGDARSVPFIALEWGALALWGWKRRDHLRFIAPLALVLAVGLLVPHRVMAQAIVFGGDGGALVLGVVFMASIFLPETARLARGGLRWGFLVIGAGSFTNVAVQWWRAWRDPAEIPFGRIEGVGLSDPSRLVDQHGWSEHTLVLTYLALAAACAVVFLAAWGWKLARTRRSA